MAPGVRRAEEAYERHCGEEDQRPHCAHQGRQRKPGGAPSLRVKGFGLAPSGDALGRLRAGRGDDRRWRRSDGLHLRLEHAGLRIAPCGK